MWSEWIRLKATHFIVRIIITYCVTFSSCSMIYSVSILCMQNTQIYIYTGGGDVGPFTRWYYEVECAERALRSFTVATSATFRVLCIINKNRTHNQARYISKHVTAKIKALLMVHKGEHFSLKTFDLRSSMFVALIFYLSTISMHNFDTIQ